MPIWIDPHNFQGGSLALSLNISRIPIIILNLVLLAALLSAASSSVAHGSVGQNDEIVYSDTFHFDEAKLGPNEKIIESHGKQLVGISPSSSAPSAANTPSSIGTNAMINWNPSTLWLQARGNSVGWPYPSTIVLEMQVLSPNGVWSNVPRRTCYTASSCTTSSWETFCPIPGTWKLFVDAHAEDRMTIPVQSASGSTVVYY